MLRLWRDTPKPRQLHFGSGCAAETAQCLDIRPCRSNALLAQALPVFGPMDEPVGLASSGLDVEAFDYLWLRLPSWRFWNKAAC